MLLRRYLETLPYVGEIFGDTILKLAEAPRVAEAECVGKGIGGVDDRGKSDFVWRGVVAPDDRDYLRREMPPFRDEVPDLGVGEREKLLLGFPEGEILLLYFFEYLKVEVPGALK